MMFSLVAAILTTPVVAKVSLGELSDVRSFLPTQTGLGERDDDNNLRDLRFRRIGPSPNSFFGNSSWGPNPNFGGSSGSFFGNSSSGPNPISGGSSGSLPGPIVIMCHQKSWIQCSSPCDWNYLSGSCEREEWFALRLGWLVSKLNRPRRFTYAMLSFSTKMWFFPDIYKSNYLHKRPRFYYSGTMCEHPSIYVTHPADAIKITLTNV